MPLPRLRVALLFLAVLVTVNGEAFAFAHNMPGEFDYYALVLAHGICSGPDPAQYFGVARELYERVKVPESLSASDSTKSFSVDEIETAFESSNPGLEPEMIAVSCRGENLLDVRICFGRDLFPRACGANEDEPRLCRINKIAVPPVERAKP